MPTDSKTTHQPWMELRAAAFHVVGHLVQADFHSDAYGWIADSLRLHESTRLLEPADPTEVVIGVDSHPVRALLANGTPNPDDAVRVPFVPVLFRNVPALLGHHNVVMAGVIAEGLAWSLGDVDSPDSRVARRRLGSSSRPTSFDGWMRHASWRDRCALTEADVTVPDDRETPHWLIERHCLGALGVPFDADYDLFSVMELAGLIHASWPRVAQAAEALVGDTSRTLGQTLSVLKESDAT